MARDRRRWLIAVALVLLVALAGCSGSGGGDAGGGGAPATAAAEDVQDQGTAAEKSGDGERAGSADYGAQDGQTRQRALVRTGTVALTVDDYDATRRNLTQRTRAYGGFVSDTGEQVHTRENRSWTTGELVLRVPKENFSALLEETKRAGEVREASTGTKDVTDQLVDLGARLENLRNQRDQLRELYEEANETETVLQIQERLSEVQTEIERLEAQRESLRQRVAYSTLTVGLNEPEPESSATVDPDKWYETGLLSAFVSSARGVVVVARGLAVGLAYATPYLLAFGVPVVGAVAFWRRRQRSPRPSAVRENAQAGDSNDGE
ncbi:DUF4349 domain-containing protein [Halorussus litoreus]|uniref:DUF4349 domain-containing protein n=1 Tax=Halorussus litoreus TaxID=1710536 RepID=UPI000E271E33|nr:DUF4349 domain-containing protein [Halorussus litoreus]